MLIGQTGLPLILGLFVQCLVFSPLCDWWIVVNLTLGSFFKAVEVILSLNVALQSKVISQLSANFWAKNDQQKKIMPTDSSGTPSNNVHVTVLLDYTVDAVVVVVLVPLDAISWLSIICHSEFAIFHLVLSSEAFFCLKSKIHFGSGGIVVRFYVRHISLKLKGMILWK